jgi:hypothetical protein
MSHISDWNEDGSEQGHGWVRAQMLRLRARCAYCGKPTDPESWAGEDGDDWGRHLMCRPCWDTW